MFKYIILLLSIIFSTSAIGKIGNTEKYDFRWMHVPVVCGTSDEVQRYLKDNEFELDSVSIGREEQIKMAFETLLGILFRKQKTVQNQYQQLHHLVAMKLV